MKKCPLFTALLGLSLLTLTANAQEPAPADVGVAQNAKETGTEPAGQAGEATLQETQKTPTPVDPAARFNQQIADLEKEIQSLRGTLKDMGDAQKEVQQLKGKVGILERDNQALLERVDNLEDTNDALNRRVRTLEGDNLTLNERLQEVSEKVAGLDSEPRQQVTAKPAFVKSAVRFYNHEGRALKMNVNGVWHTLKEGENTIWVPYGPVHIYRYTNAEPKTFIDWKPHMDGYLMQFDVGTPPAR